MNRLWWGEDIKGEAVNGQKGETLVLAERRLVPREYRKTHA
jgi:hypothetical protein